MTMHIITSANGYALGLDGRPVFVNGCRHLWHPSIEELEVALWSNNLCLEGTIVVSKREKYVLHLEKCLALN